MLDTFLSWLIPFLCGGAVTFAGTMLIKLKAIMQKRHSQGHIKHITPSAVMT